MPKSDYEWHPVIRLRYGPNGNLQQEYTRRMLARNGAAWYEHEWRDVPHEPIARLPICARHGEFTPNPNTIECPKCWPPGQIRYGLERTVDGGVNVFDAADPEKKLVRWNQHERRQLAEWLNREFPPEVLL